MARGNLFKKLESPSGEFLMFSQFAEDISRQSVDGSAYRVTPSKFAVFNLNLDPSKLDGIDDRKDPIDPSRIQNDYNAALPRIFQNYFENGIANFKEIFANEGKQFNPQYINNFLWTTLLDWGFIHKVQSSEADAISYNEWSYPELMYIGEVPFYSNRDNDNISYNEIYCHIPVSAKRCRYYLESGLGEPTAYDPIDRTKILGWNSANYPNNTGVANIEPLTNSHDATGKYDLISADAFIPQEIYSWDTYTNPTFEEVEADEYQFNCIVVFYDVWNNVDAANPSIIYRNIPLGIYFPGTIDMDVNSPTTYRLFKNPVTKYINHADAFGQGSAYGLRILTRFSPVMNSTTYYTEISTGEDVATLATMMGSLGDAISQMKATMSRANDISQDIKDHLAMFKNYRVNVPYVRMVNGMPTWFVNGRNTGRFYLGGTNIIENILERLAKLEAERTGEDWHEIYRMLKSFNDDFSSDTWDDTEQVDEEQTFNNVNILNS